MLDRQMDELRARQQQEQREKEREAAELVALKKQLVAEEEAKYLAGLKMVEQTRKIFKEQVLQAAAADGFQATRWSCRVAGEASTFCCRFDGLDWLRERSCTSVVLLSAARPHRWPVPRMQVPRCMQ
jgi:hypothetical protein